MSENRIIAQLIMLVKYVEELQGISGEQKKAYVVEHLHDTFDISDELKPLLSEFIDVLISVDKGRLKLVKKKVKKFFIC